MIPSCGQEKTVEHSTQWKKQLKNKIPSSLQTLYFNLVDEEIQDGREQDAGSNKIQETRIRDKPIEGGEARFQGLSKKKIVLFLGCRQQVVLPYTGAPIGDVLTDTSSTAVLIEIFCGYPQYLQE